MFEEFKSAFTRYNNAHVQLIIINVVVFVAMGLLALITTVGKIPGVYNFIFSQLSLSSHLPEFLTHPWTLITYSFAHSLSYIFHILFNMLVFYWFGRLFVEYLGSDKLVALYVLGALAGGIAYLLVFNFVPYYAENYGAGRMVGASAAVYAVVVAVATLLPNYTFFLLFLGPVRIKYIALFYIVISLLGSLGDNAGGNIAHLGGALIGFIYIKQLHAGVNWGSWVTITLDWFKSLFKEKRKVKVSYRKQEESATYHTTKPDAKTSQEEIDMILDKISDHGYESLTKEEKEKLFNASKRS